jgi:hypothetical protein
LPTSISSYLVSVVPELKVNGVTVKTGSSMRLGEELDFVTGIRFAGKGYRSAPRTSKVVAGSYLHVNVFAGSVSPVKFKKLQAKLESTKNTLESSNQAQIAALTRDDILGDMFYAGGLGYYAQLLSLSKISGLSSKGFFQLGVGYGTIGYEPRQNTFFGFPRSITTGGVVFDIPMLIVTANQAGDEEKTKQFTMKVGALGSALEHKIPEQIYKSTKSNAPKPDAISAIKALQKASAEGQKIYQINQANMNQVLPLLHHDRDTLNEIRSALNAGKDVTTHTDAVSIPGGWSGFGYIIIDPIVGDGAYKISGGINGSFMLGLFIGLALVALLVVAAASGLALAIAAIVASIGVNGAFLSLFYIDLSGEDFDARCFASGLLIGMTAASLILGTALIGSIMTALGLGAAFSPNMPTPVACLGI